MKKTVPNRSHLTELDESDKPCKGLKTKTGDKPETAPLRICIAFDEEASERSAEVLIKNVPWDLECETQSFQFDELQTSAQYVAAIRTGSVVGLLVVRRSLKYTFSSSSHE